ncbi:helix-turn-helix transcriptional regulator [Pasteurella sp. PK-2025]|uniref:helix-turn-helix transcriptional regulator n=1 Tax=Pasteurella sp. PK-2025 TaxID=3413133 RepID=UPI003C76BC27
MERLIPLKEFLEITGVKKSTAYNRGDPNSKYFDPEFPQPIHRKGKLLFSYTQT